MFLSAAEVRVGGCLERVGGCLQLDPGSRPGYSPAAGSAARSVLGRAAARSRALQPGRRPGRRSRFSAGLQPDHGLCSPVQTGLHTTGLDIMSHLFHHPRHPFQEESAREQARHEESEAKLAEKM
ncbi:unnamed protein product [Boreogadus saida]